MYKKIYDKNKGKYIFVDSWTGEELVETVVGSGIFDTLASIGQKVFSSSVGNVGKKVLETVGKTALESGTKRIGTEIGNVAADKITKVFTKQYKPKPNGDLIVKELTKLNKNAESALPHFPLERPAESNYDNDMGINRLLSGSGLRPLAKGGSGSKVLRQRRINKLISY